MSLRHVPNFVRSSYEKIHGRPSIPSSQMLSWLVASLPKAENLFNFFFHPKLGTNITIFKRIVVLTPWSWEYIFVYTYVCYYLLCIYFLNIYIFIYIYICTFVVYLLVRCINQWIGIYTVYIYIHTIVLHLQTFIHAILHSF